MEQLSIFSSVYPIGSNHKEILWNILEKNKLMYPTSSNHKGNLWNFLEKNKLMYPTGPNHKEILWNFLEKTISCAQPSRPLRKRTSIKHTSVKRTSGADWR